MLTPITCLTLACDGCGTLAEDCSGSVCHFTAETEARELFGLDPHASEPGEMFDRWHFGADGTHRCPDCQCTAHGHLPGQPHLIGASAEDPAYLGTGCLRCGRWLDLGPATLTDADDSHGDHRDHAEERYWAAFCTACGTSPCQALHDHHDHHDHHDQDDDAGGAGPSGQAA